MYLHELIEAVPAAAVLALSCARAPLSARARAMLAHLAAWADHDAERWVSAAELGAGLYGRSEQVLFTLVEAGYAERLAAAGNASLWRITASGQRAAAEAASRGR